MTGVRFTKLLSTGVLAVLIACGNSTSYAVTAAKNNNARKNKNSSAPITYIQDISLFHSSLPLQISSVERLIALSDDDLLKRLSGFAKDNRIEPIQLTASADDEKILDLAGRISKPGRKLAVANYLRENFEKGEEVPGTNLRLVSISEPVFQWMDKSKIDELFAKEHFELTVRSADLKRNRTMQTNFLTQLTPYLTTAQIQGIRGKIAAAKNLIVDQDLLPDFARRMIRHHTVFKGPNCFHAALSFQSPLISKSSLVNVREEPGYHRSMINYDEMWRAAQLDFYEVDPAKTEIKYGDMILFFDAPKVAQASVDFKTLRHAATYLFGGYVFAKGSKSANSPYIIRPLADEWSTWAKYTDNLGVKVFRRNLKHVNKAATWDPVDWLY